MKYTLILAILSVAALSACNETSTEIQQRQQEQVSLQGAQSVGMPAITNFAEKRMMKDIIEMRDQSVATITYIVGMNNEYKKLCNSVGFGLPYATQYTNPMRSQQYGPIPQADPNGLFSPSSAEGTWILCVNPETKKAVPIYVEPRVIISQFELK